MGSTFSTFHLVCQSIHSTPTTEKYYTNTILGGPLIQLAAVFPSIRYTNHAVAAKLAIYAYQLDFYTS